MFRKPKKNLELNFTRSNQSTNPNTNLNTVFTRYSTESTGIKTFHNSITNRNNVLKADTNKSRNKKYRPTKSLNTLRKSSYKDIKEYRVNTNYADDITQLSTEILQPLRKAISNKQEKNDNFQNKVNEKEEDISIMNRELDLTMRRSSSFKKDSNCKLIYIQKLLSENNFISKEIQKLATENANLRNEINAKDKQKIEFENEYMNEKEQLDDYKRECKELSDKVNHLIDEKRQLKSAILFMNRKLFAIKMQNQNLMKNSVFCSSGVKSLKNIFNIDQIKQEMEDEED